jgi:two-component system phosphate regulon sensor histidine kinase PhoR
MRKALLERFILVLLAALCINSVIFYIASSKMMLKNSKNDMTYTIKAVDSILDYDRDLMEQMERLEAFTDQDSSRVTLIKSDGTVVTDSDADAEYLDNHQGREEIRAAMEHGEGYARRYSKTLGKTMLYVACRSEYSDMVLRLAVPYSGIQEYLAVSGRHFKLPYGHGLLRGDHQTLCVIGHQTPARYLESRDEGKGGLHGAAV